MVEHVLVPETIRALRLSRIQKEGVGTLWDSKHVERVHEETHTDRLVVKSWARFKEKRVLVVDDCNYLFVRLYLDSEGGVLNHKLKVILACSRSASLVQKDALSWSSILVVSIGADSMEYQVIFINR